MQAGVALLAAADTISDSDAENTSDFEQLDSVNFVDNFHACSYCGKSFLTSSGLKQHQHIHSSVKPFQCEVCLKAYTQFSNLCRHKRMHADCRRQIKCRDCGQAFSTIHSLNKHKRYCDSIPRINVSSKPADTNMTSPRNLDLFYASHGLQNAQHASSRISGVTQPLPSTSSFAAHAHLHSAFPALHPIAPEVMSWLSLMKAYAPSAKMYEATVKSLCQPPPRQLSQQQLSRQSDATSSSSPACQASSSRPETDCEENNNQGISPKKSSPKSHTAKVGNQLIFRPFDDPDDSDDTSEDSGVRPSGAIDLRIDDKESWSKDTDKLVARDLHSKSQVFTSKFLASNDSLRHNRESAKLAIIKPMTSKLSDDKLLANTEIIVPKVSQKRKLAQSENLDLSSARGMHKFMRPLTSDVMPLTPPQTAADSLSQLHYLRTSYAKQQSAELYNNYLQRLRNLPVIQTPYNPFWSGTFSKHKYSCKFCGKVFPRSANLTRHLRTHTGEQPYKCKYCERSFSISSNLQRHIRNIHNKEKPYNCSLCGRSFGQQTNLDRHLRSHELQEALSRGDQIDDVMTEHFDKAEAVDERNEMPGGEKDDDDDGVGTEYDVDGDVMCDVITHEHNAKPLILD